MPAPCAPTAELRHFAHPQMRATEFLADPVAVGGPPITAIAKRLTFDLHTCAPLGGYDVGPADTVETLTGVIPGGPKGIITYFLYDPSKVDQGAWKDPEGPAETEPDGDGPRVIAPEEQPDPHILEGDDDE